MITSWHSFPKVWALGHSAIKELLLDEVVIEEKVDGSQFSFGKFGNELKCRSKGQQIDLDAMNPNDMFANAVATARELMPLLNDGWTYRAEYLRIPKHNVHAYTRTPNKHLIVFDINHGEEGYLTRKEKEVEAQRIGLEIVPAFFVGKLENVEQFYSLLEKESVLGGQKIEGVVVKNYFRYGVDKKVLMGKYVSESFKEKHTKEWKEMNPLASDIIEILKAKYKSEARWQKAVQHLTESGKLLGEPKDIAALMKEVNIDAHTELKDEIMEDLFKWAWPKISPFMTYGLPEWYKKQLAQKQFDRELEGL